MPSLQPESRIVVPPFIEQIDGDDAIIANAARSVFLAVPREAVTLLHFLADGCTVGEASARFERMYQVPPDIDDFVQSLSAEGFLEPGGISVARPRHYHLDHIPVDVARRIWSWPVLVCGGVLIALGLLAC